MQIETERGALDHVPFVELVQWCNRFGLELVGNTKGGLTLRRQRPLTTKHKEHTNDL